MKKPAWCGLWYGELRQAISYAQWAERDFENAEIRVYKRDGTLEERRVLKGDSGPAKLGLQRVGSRAGVLRPSRSYVFSSCRSAAS